VSAAIGHARQIALYNRAPAGVVFFKFGNNPEILAFVEQAKLIPGNPTTLDDRYMEIIPGEEIVTMPPGVAVQLLSAVDPGITNPSPPPTNLPERYLRAGIVLFDENGQLVTTPYWIPPPYADTNWWPPSYTGPASYARTGVDLGSNLQISSASTSAGMTPGSLPLCGSPGICLYDDDAYRSQVDPNSQMSFAQIDDTTNSFDSTYYGMATPSYFAAAQYAYPTAAQKVAEMNWLDQNGETLVIKPNDGSLLRNQ
jgi:hypothetical protein